jgi:hypothetical protein
MTTSQRKESEEEAMLVYSRYYRSIRVDGLKTRQNHLNGGVRVVVPGYLPQVGERTQKRQSIVGRNHVDRQGHLIERGAEVK